MYNIKCVVGDVLPVAIVCSIYCMSQVPAANAVECYFRALQITRHEVAHLVQAQPYRAEGCGFDCRWGLWDCSLI
jgi:hypothetical protein